MLCSAVLICRNRLSPNESSLRSSGVSPSQADLSVVSSNFWTMSSKEDDRQYVLGSSWSSAASVASYAASARDVKA